MPAGKMNRYRRKPRARKRARGPIGRYRPKYTLNTLQISNVRPSTMRIPIEVKQQFFCRALASSASDGCCLFFNMSSPIAISHTTGGTSQQIPQLAAMYQHGHVLGSKLEYSIKFLQHRPDMTASGTIVDSNPNELVQGVYSQGGIKRINGVCNYSPRKILGVKDVTDVNDLKFNLGTVTGSTEETFACVNVQHDFTSSSATGAIHKTVLVTKPTSSPTLH